jgi:hypothetical protein
MTPIEQAVVDAARRLAVAAKHDKDAWVPELLKDVIDAVTHLDMVTEFLRAQDRYIVTPGVRVIAGQRATGKTTAAIEWVKGGHQYPDGSWSRVILFATTSLARDCQRRAGLHRDQTDSIRAWQNTTLTRSRTGTKPEYIIDDLDYALGILINGGTPYAVTITVPTVDGDTITAAHQMALNHAEQLEDRLERINDIVAPIKEAVSAGIIYRDAAGERIRYVEQIGKIQ